MDFKQICAFFYRIIIVWSFLITLEGSLVVSDENTSLSTSPTNVTVKPPSYSIPQTLVNIDYKSVGQQDRRKTDGIISIVKDTPLTKCASNCMHKENCDSFNFNFNLMNCELVQKGSSTLNNQKGWTYFSSYSWSQTYSAKCAKRPCLGRQACLETNKGEFFCLVLQCDLPDARPGVIATYTSLQFGSFLVFSCEPGVASAGNSTVTCQEDGSWTSSTFECRCGTPPSKTNAYYTNFNREVGTKIYYRCRTYSERKITWKSFTTIYKRYRSNGQTPWSTCQSNGTWTYTVFSCFK